MVLGDSCLPSDLAASEVRSMKKFPFGIVSLARLR